MCPWSCGGTKWLTHGLDGRDPAVVALLPYDSGLRIMGALRLRAQDIDFGMKAVAVPSGKGGNDRAACRVVRNGTHAVRHCCSPLRLAH
jgi:site-specific recombinase XerC